ncbi:MAG: ABC transporter permease [Ignavibacteriales bacterium]
MIFWTLVFPLVLGTFFNMAFSNINNKTEFEPVKLAIVNDEKFNKLEDFKVVIESLSKDDNKIFDTKYVDEDEAKQLLNDNKVSGYLIVNDKIDIVVKSNGINESTIKYVVDNYYQVTSVIGNIAKYNPEALKSDILSNFENNNFKNTNNDNVDSTVVYFYTLLGMVCLYGGFFGVNAVNETEANLSKKGARVCISPVHKLKVLITSLLVGLLVQYMEVLILLGYLMFVLNIDFGNQILPILILTFLGSIAGMSLGMLIGVSNKGNEEAKMGILVSVTMTCSFLAGMMFLQMKYIIAENVPFLAKINPVNMITDGLYALYYYDTLDRYLYNVISLIIFSIIMISLSYIFIRRKKYDSI